MLTLLNLFLPILAAFHPKPVEITKGPYISFIDLNPEKKTYEMTVMWETKRRENFKLILNNHETKALIAAKSPEGYLYQVRLNGLKADTTYHYRIIPLPDKEHTIKTPPLDGLRFIAMGDSRSFPEVFSKILKLANSLDPDLIISMGDLVEEGGDIKQWDQQFFAPSKEVLNHIPFIPALGDHEGDNDNGKLLRLFFFPKKNYRKLWFSFDVGNAHFVALDYRYPESEEMIHWFEEDMKKTKAKWKFVFMHRPCYNFGGHRSAWGRSIWPDLFSKYKVDFVFAGHSHIYERFYPMKKNNKSAWPVTYITTGGAGAEVYEIGKSEFLAKTAAVHHLVLFEIKGDTLKMKTCSVNGTVIDELTLTKEKGTYSREYLKSVKPQEEVDLITMFLNAITQSINSIPLYDIPTILNITLSPQPEFGVVKFKIHLSPESAKNYYMKEVHGILYGEEETIPVKIYSRTEMIVSQWGDIEPPLRLECIINLRRKELRIKSGRLDYWPE